MSAEIIPFPSDRVGWICPKCKKVISPDVKECKSKICKKENFELDEYFASDTMDTRQLLNE